MRIGLVGAGRMGRPMVHRLVTAGYRVQALGRSVPAREALTTDGARAVSSAAAAGAGADVVLICVYTDEQVRDVCLDSELLAGMPGGSVLVVHTTCSPRTIEAVAARAAPHRIDVVDAAVSGGPHDIAAARLTLFVGGAGDALARVQPVLQAYGDPILPVGPPGAGQRVKLGELTRREPPGGGFQIPGLEDTDPQFAERYRRDAPLELGELLSGGV